MDFTLVIPTFNRHAWLAGLLRYLARARMAGRVLVLDSSREDVARQNRALVEASGLEISVAAYPESLPFSQKLAEGLRQVRSAYCGLCADDDLVLPGGVAACVDFLASHPDHAGAHGLYFAFGQDGRRYFVDEIVYRHDSLDAARPAARLAQLLDDYQSNFYGVYRTAVQAEAIAAAAANESSLFFELAQSALTAIAGRIARLPLVYAGRRRSPSAGSPTRWHPVEWAAADPRELGRHYLAYHARLVARLESAGGLQPGEASALDLVHLRYLFQSIRDAGLKAAIAGQLEGAAREELVARAFAGASHPFAGAPGFPSSRAWRAYFALRSAVAPARRLLDRAAVRLQLLAGGDTALRREAGGTLVELNPPVPGQIRSQAPDGVEAAIEAIHAALQAYDAAAAGSGPG